MLTAAHCGVTGDNASDFQVFVGEVVGGVGTGVDVIDVRVHPGFVAATFASDVAVLWLRDDVPVVPARLPETTLAFEVGGAVRVVGYGVSAAGAADQGTRRQGSATISEVTEAEVTLAPAPSQPCSYDSGGPAFVVVAGVELLAGVTSRGDSGCVTTSCRRRSAAWVTSRLRPRPSCTAACRAATSASCSAATSDPRRADREREQRQPEHQQRPRRDRSRRSAARAHAAAVVVVVARRHHHTRVRRRRARPRGQRIADEAQLGIDPDLARRRHAAHTACGCGPAPGWARRPRRTGRTARAGAASARRCSRARCP